MRRLLCLAAFCVLGTPSYAQQPQWVRIYEAPQVVTVQRPYEYTQRAPERRPPCNTPVAQRPQPTPERVAPPQLSSSAPRPQLNPERRRPEPVTFRQPQQESDLVPSTERPIARVPRDQLPERSACPLTCKDVLLTGNRGSFLLSCGGSGTIMYALEDDSICPSASIREFEPAEPDDLFVYYREEGEGATTVYAIEKQEQPGRRHRIWMKTKRNPLDRGWKYFQLATRHGA
jgi:hypothetical protein